MTRSLIATYGKELTMEPAREVTYDAKADALYLGLVTGFVGRASTHTLPGGINIDCCDGVPVGIEVLNASRSMFAAMVPTMQGGTLESYHSDYSAEVPA